MQIKDSYKAIIAGTFLGALLLVTAFEMKEKMGQVKDTSGVPAKFNAISFKIHILMMNDKVEAFKKFITGWQEIRDKD